MHETAKLKSEENYIVDDFFQTYSQKMLAALRFVLFDQFSKMHQRV